MKRSVFVLLAVLALIPSAQLLAQAPLAVPPANCATAPTPGVASFLATLSEGEPRIPGDPMPAPSFMTTHCTSNSDCPTGQLCCFMCGNPPDDGSSCRVCTTPFKGRCPLVV